MSFTTPVEVRFAAIVVELPEIEPAAGQTPAADGEACVRTSALPPVALMPDAVPDAVSAKSVVTFGETLSELEKPPIETAPLVGAAVSFWIVKLVVELGLPAASVVSASNVGLPVVLGVKVKLFESKVPVPGVVDVPAAWVMLEPPLAKLEVVIESPPEPPSVVAARRVKLFAPVPSEPL